MIVKIFTKEDSPEMRVAKEMGGKLESLGYEVEYMDADNQETVTAQEIYDIYSFPSFAVTTEDGQLQECWRGKMPLESDIKMFLNQ